MGLPDAPTVAPSQEPVTLAEAKKQLEILDSDTVHNDQISALITAAREEAEKVTGRVFITQTWTLTRDRFPDWRLPIPKPPLQSITSIKYIDTDGAQQEIDPSEYRVATNNTPGNVEPAYGEVWPTAQNTSEAVEIEFVAGYGDPKDVPQRAKQAMLLMVAEWFERRTALSEIPQAAMALLSTLKTGMAAGSYALT